jgi:hypothetical protein
MKSMRTALVSLALALGMPPASWAAATCPFAPVGPALPGALAIDSDGRWAVVASGDEGVMIHDLSRSASFRLEAAAPFAVAEDVVVSNGLAYVAVGLHGLEIIDLRGEEPRMIGSFDFAEVQAEGWATGVALDGGRAFLADYLGGRLWILDVGDPSAPAVVGVVDDLGAPYRVAAAEGVAFVADSQASGIWMVDVSRPALAEPVDFRPLGLPALDLLAEPPLLVASNVAGVSLFDTSDPESVAPIAEFESAGGGFGLDLRGKQLFVAGGKTVDQFDLRRPDHPRLVLQIAVPGFALGVAVRGDTLLVTDPLAGVYAGAARCMRANR